MSRLCNAHRRIEVRTVQFENLMGNLGNVGDCGRKISKLALKMCGSRLAGSDLCNVVGCCEYGIP